MEKAVKLKNSSKSFARDSWCIGSFSVMNHYTHCFQPKKSSQHVTHYGATLWGQSGTPHPQAWMFESVMGLLVFLPRMHGLQAPNNPKARMFKVLKEVVEDQTSGTKSESGVTQPKLAVEPFTQNMWLSGYSRYLFPEGCVMLPAKLC